MKKWFISFLFLLSTIFLLISPVFAAGFSTSDLGGTWRGYFQESTSTADRSYWIYGDLAIDGEGNVTGGTWTAVTGTTGDFVGGSLTLDRQGVLTGTLSTHENGEPAEEILEMTVVHAKMDTGKELAQGVVLKDSGDMDLVTLVRTGSSSLSLSDLNGNWFGFFHFTDAGPVKDFWYDSVSIENGVITDGTWSLVREGNTGALAGSFTVDSATAEVSWDLLSSYFDGGGVSKSRMISTSGQLSGSGTVFAGVDIRTTGGIMDIGLYLKAGEASYQTAELQGTWAGYFQEISSGGSFVYWVYGSITLDAEGNCTGGEWESVSGTTGTFTGGAVAMDADGKLSGTLTSSDGLVMTLNSGFMAAGKRMAAAILSNPHPGGPGQRRMKQM